jgi:hypothetical protein
MRRDVSFGTGKGEALELFLERAGARMSSYAANERADYADTSGAAVARRLIHGTVEDCACAIRELAAAVPVTTLVVRPHWPDMDRRELLDYLAQLGELVDAVA